MNNNKVILAVHLSVPCGYNQDQLMNDTLIAINSIPNTLNSSVTAQFTEIDILDKHQGSYMLGEKFFSKKGDEIIPKLLKCLTIK
jgi:hypothetical protein